MKKSLLFIILSILTLPIFLFAQDETEKEENPPFSFPENTPITYPTISSPILLPMTNDSWTINVHSEGGIMGIKYLALALNSEGKYQCSEKSETKTLLLKNEHFIELDKMIKNYQNGFYSKSLTDKSLYCNDCLYHSLSLFLTAKSEKKEEVSEKPKVEKKETTEVENELQKVRDIYTKSLKAVDCKKTD